MLTRVPALALLLALGACASSPDVDPAADPANDRDPHRIEPVSLVGCDGVAYEDVRGPEPGEPNGSLRDHPVADAACSAWWLDLADDFVPQGLEIDGSVAYVVGHRAAAVGQKLCQVAVVRPAFGADSRVHRRARRPGRQPVVSPRWRRGAHRRWSLGHPDRSPVAPRPRSDRQS